MITGRRLRSERLRRGLTLEDIAGELKIKKEWVQALEEEDSTLFVGEFYYRAFQKAYIRYLGLEDNPAGTPALVGAGNVTKAAPRDHPWHRSTYIFLGSLLVTGIMIIMGWWYQNVPRSSSVPPSLAEPKESPFIHHYTKDKLDIITVQPGYWSLRARNEAQVEITVDGIRIFSGFLHKGDHMEIKARNHLEVRAQNLNQVLELSRLSDQGVQGGIHNPMGVE